MQLNSCSFHPMEKDLERNVKSLARRQKRARRSRPTVFSVIDQTFATVLEERHTLSFLAAPSTGIIRKGDSPWEQHETKKSRPFVIFLQLLSIPPCRACSGISCFCARLIRVSEKYWRIQIKNGFFSRQVTTMPIKSPAKASFAKSVSHHQPKNFYSQPLLIHQKTSL